MAAQTPKSTRVRMCHVISHGDLNECQGVSTGLLLRWMDICACLSAEKLSKTSCVTLSMDHLVLNVPDGSPGVSSAAVGLGCAIIVEASVVQVWNTSTEIIVRVLTDPHMQPITASRTLLPTLLASAFFVFCGMKVMDPASQKLVCPKMPAFAAETAAETRARQMADLRRQARLGKEAMIKEAQHRKLGDHSHGVLAASEHDARLGERVLVSESLLHHVHIVMPPHANHMGNMFGGIYMEW
jgi:acyl-CoA hydrolase